MAIKKDRKHSGRKTICIQDKDYPFEQAFWDDWNDYRDGFRGSRDKTLIRKKGLGYDKKMGKNLDSIINANNKKLKRYFKIRITRKEKLKNRQEYGRNCIL